eukprot:gene13792-19701_t
MSSTEGWVEIMYQTADTVGVGQQPIVNHKRSMEIFSVVFIIIGSFLVLGLVASVVIHRFKILRGDAGDRSALLTEKQQQWLTIRKILASSAVKTRHMPPTHPLRYAAFHFVTSTVFDWLIMAVIIFSIIILCLYHEGLANGTRLIVEDLRQHLIVAKIVTGC